MKFESVHYSEVKAIEKLNDEMFVTCALDGFINIWNTRMRKLIWNLNVNDSGVSSLKFISKRGLLLVGHEGGISSFTARDNFESK